MMWGYGWGWPAMLWMSLGSIFWLVALGLLAWAIVHWLSGHTPVHNHLPRQESSALELLRQRYARGEIDTTAFEQMREQLERSGSHLLHSAPQDSNDLNAPQS